LAGICVFCCFESSNMVKNGVFRQLFTVIYSLLPWKR